MHIDFGMIFDQGQLLRIPETVPFRLTRNIVDGLGVLGTEGTVGTAIVVRLNMLPAFLPELLSLTLKRNDFFLSYYRNVPTVLRASVGSSPGQH